MVHVAADDFGVKKCEIVCDCVASSYLLDFKLLYRKLNEMQIYAHLTCKEYIGCTSWLWQLVFENGGESCK